MKQKCTGIICLLLASGILSAAQSFLSLSTVYAGTRAYNPDHANVFSFISNPASLASLETASVTVFGERRFLLKELDNYIIVIGLPASAGHFGMEAGYNGFAGYQETKLGLAYARNLDKKIGIGVQFNYQSIGIAGYGKTSVLGFAAGTIWRLNDCLHIGIQVSNPVGGKFGKSYPGNDRMEKLPSIYTVGSGYQVSEKFYTSIVVGKEEDEPVNANLGFVYKVLPQVEAAFGVSTAASLVWFGIGFNLKRIRLDILSSYHPQLGITPALLLSTTFNSGKNKNTGN